MGVDTASVRNEQARRRYEALAKRVYQPVQRSLFIDAGLLALTVVLSYVIASATGQLAAVVLVVWLGTGVAAGAAWGWLVDPARRAAFEVLMDHTNRESQAWKTETGTSLPATVRGAEQWLQEHPDKPGQATILARLGRLDEARDDLKSQIPPTPEEELHVEIVLGQLDLYAGHQPDTKAIHQRWQTLPETEARGFRRGCLATLDALIAADRGIDPWPALAAARSEIGAIDPSSQARRYVRVLVTMHILFAATVWFAAAITAG